MHAPGDGVIHALVDCGENPAIALADVIDVDHFPGGKVRQSKLLKLTLCKGIGNSNITIINFHTNHTSLHYPPSTWELAYADQHHIGSPHRAANICQPDDQDLNGISFFSFIIIPFIMN